MRLRQLLNTQINGRRPTKPAQLRQLREMQPPTSPSDFFEAPKIQRVGSPGTSGRPDGDHPVAVAKVGFKSKEHCLLAHGQPKQYRALDVISRREHKPPCFSGCDRVQCCQHPAHLERYGSTAEVWIGTHDSQRLPVSDTSIFDERPHDLIVVHEVCVSKRGSTYTFGPLDRIVKLLSAVGADKQCRDVERVRRALRDVYDDRREKCASQAMYRCYAAPSLRWSEEDRNAVERAILVSDRSRAIGIVTDEQFYKKLGLDLDHRVREDLDLLCGLFVDGDALWFWRDNELKVVRAENRWASATATATKQLLIFDASSNHYAYAAAPSEVEFQVHRFERPAYSGVRFVFGKERITKGRGSAKVGKQTEYILACLHRLIGERSLTDVLVVTHEAAEASVLAALHADLDVSRNFNIVGPGESASADDRRPVLYVDHFGALKSTNRYRACGAVIIGHLHGLPVGHDAAIALCLFPDLRLRRESAASASGVSKHSHEPVPRQWTPVRRGVAGANATEPGLYSPTFDFSYSPHVNLIARSHLVTEIVQAATRARCRENPAADTTVFVPVGTENTPLAVSVMRELPGATCEWAGIEASAKELLVALTDECEFLNGLHGHLPPFVPTLECLRGSESPPRYKIKAWAKGRAAELHAAHVNEHVKAQVERERTPEGLREQFLDLMRECWSRLGADWVPTPPLDEDRALLEVGELAEVGLVDRALKLSDKLHAAMRVEVGKGDPAMDPHKVVRVTVDNVRLAAVDEALRRCVPAARRTPTLRARVRAIFDGISDGDIAAAVTTARAGTGWVAVIAGRVLVERLLQDRNHELRKLSDLFLWDWVKREGAVSASPDSKVLT